MTAHNCQNQKLTDNCEASVKTIPWPIKLFLLSLLIPTEASFLIGSFRLTPYRVVLLLFFLPCFFHVFSGKAGKILKTDWLLLGYCGWMFLALSIHHGFSSGLESAGILTIESLSAYLMARMYIRNDLDFASLAKLLIIIVIALSFITIPEAITGINVIRPHIAHIGRRLGIVRSFGPFDHAILYGVFCASIVSFAIYVPTKNNSHDNSSFFRTFWIITATFVSVSSGALAAVIVQLILACWKRLTKEIEARWNIFIVLLILAYLTIDLLSNRTPIRVIIHRLTFSAQTAYNRLIIWEWGTKHNVAEHPFLGIGFNDWVRPTWMISTSMDNFWLVNMVRYGLPAFALLAFGILALFLPINRTKGETKSIALMKTAWSFTIVGLIVAGCTVHFWNSLYSWFFFILGSGAWLISPTVLKEETT